MYVNANINWIEVVDKFSPVDVMIICSSNFCKYNQFDLFFEEKSNSGTLVIKVCLSVTFANNI
jgi:hypothetical protein